MGLDQRVTGGGIIGGITARNGAMAVATAPYDSMLWSSPAANTVATVTFPATPGRAWLINYASFGLDSAALVTTAVHRNIQIIDGVTAIWSSYISLTAVTATTAQSNSVTLNNVAYVGSIGASVTVTFSSAAGANVFENVNAAGYLI
jgi:hypothetical protein